MIIQFDYVSAINMDKVLYMVLFPSYGGGDKTDFYLKGLKKPVRVDLPLEDCMKIIEEKTKEARI